MFSTTLAVLRPTPGKACSAARDEGTCPPKVVDQHPAQLDDVLRLVAEKADGLDMVDQPSSPRPASFPACRRSGTACRVALFTPTSVACADRATATSKGKGVHMLQLALRIGLGLVEAGEDLLQGWIIEVAGHALPMHHRNRNALAAQAARSGSHLAARCPRLATKETAMTDQAPAYHYAVIARALREIDAAGPGLTLDDTGGAHGR
jgi:hypothetical protein